jgi:hypothetical protein
MKREDPVERRKQVAKAIEEEGLSHRMIADQLGINKDTVSEDKKKIEAERGQKIQPLNGKTLGKDGKQRNWPDCPTRPAKSKDTDDLIDFGSLRYVPTNVTEVFFLFAEVAEDLGFAVDSITLNSTGRPICEGVCKKGKKESHVRIGFNGPGTDCDSAEQDLARDGVHRVVVCWTDARPKSERSPNVEVIELREEIERLRSQTA